MKVGVIACGGPQGLSTDPDACFKGVSTHLRSEGTYILEHALNLARHGIEVEYQCEMWGSNDIPHNLNIVKTITDCDVLLSSGLEEYSTISNNLHLHFWGSTSDELNCLSGKHIYLQGYNFILNAWKNNTHGMYAPHPIYEKQLKPNVNSTNTLWANRGAFFNTQYASESEPLLQILERHQDFNHTILLFDNIREEGGNAIASRFENLHNRKLIRPLSGVNHTEFINLLSKSKFLMSFIRQQVAPTPIEAVAYGAVPFVYSNSQHNFETILKDFDLDGIKTEKLFTDDELYIEYHTALSQYIVNHSYDNSFNILMSGIKERL